MYKVTLRRVRATIVAVEKTMSITYSAGVCSLSCLACEERKPYCHLWPVRLYHIFLHSVTYGTTFGKKALNIKCVL